ncbi:glycoside hydrolase family 9 protein [uncultured Prevotella sp.]|uniref:glycoside hydrolase family 9 protein n=1 Tax=uncultured Prevotella sp. TaxID=159272 RepID=UPI00258EA895|nr:glycoside hydrolase family 9 protein [uncultured Prevotella sp.]
MKKIVLLTVLAVLIILPAKTRGQIRYNQVGCYPQQEKFIVVEDTASIHKLKIKTPKGKTLKPASIRKAVSPLSGKTRYVVNLGELTAIGNYQISIGKERCSIQVSDHPYHDIAKSSLRLFYLIRSGIPIEQGGIYKRPLGHPDTLVLIHPSAATDKRPAGTAISSPYGWYDAGDYNKYVVNSAFSIGLMFAAYEQQSTYFTNLNTEIPESHNQTPDLLDEMMFNLRWLQTMQDPDDGGVYHKLTTPNFEGFIMPTACRQPRYVVAKSITATLDFAAVMADAARLFEPYQQDYPGFTDQATIMAERAYQWAKQHPTALYRQDQLHHPEITTGTYADFNSRDELFWAASALYRLTHKQMYFEDAQQNQPQRFYTPSWGNVSALGAFEWLSAKASPLYNDMLHQLMDYCKNAIRDVEKSSFQSPFGNNARDFGWGCLAERCCCQAMALLYADKLQGTTEYRTYALQNADYLLGRNATGYCYVTGFGDQSPMHPHHRISSADGITLPFPGMLVGGPNPGQQDKKDMHNTVYPSNIPDESYIDNEESYASNEIAINWNASLAAFLCWLDALSEMSATPHDNGIQLDKNHLLLDASLSDSEVANRPFMFNNFHKMLKSLSDTTTLYIKPGVYWIDNPDIPEVVHGENGREPFGCVIRGKILHLIGLDTDARNIVLASARGQTQGAVGNFTMFDIHCDSLWVENLTMGNFCNVDLDYPLNPTLARKKRSDAITQAHVGYVHGKWLMARNVRFISRLNLNPLNGAEHSYYENCHFECTDDAMNGTAVYRHCSIDLYGQKPFWSTFNKGAMFVDCDFNVKTNNREMYFCKQGGPLTLIDCRYHAPSDSIYIGWTAYPQPWLRCYQHHFTLNGKPYIIGNRQRKNTLSPSFLNNTLREAPYLAINKHESTLQTGHDTLRLSCNEIVSWRIEEGFEKYVVMKHIDAETIELIPINSTDETISCCVIATSTDGREAACYLTIKPSQLPPPTVRNPRLTMTQDRVVLTYFLNTKEAADDSRIIWYRDSIPVATTNTGSNGIYLLQEADKGHTLRAVLFPKQKRSDYGAPIECQVKVRHTSRQDSLDTDFSQLYCDWQPVISEGLWTVDGHKPIDTSDYDWSFNSMKPMWEYGEGFNGAIGKGLLQAQRGARLMYTAANRRYDNMSLTLTVDPTKTAGQGFGSATGQYMDVCLKFDTKTLTGYGLRIIRTVKHAKAVDFLLVEYKDGQVTPLTEAISSTCYRTGCTISLNYSNGLLRAHVETKTPKPADSALPHQVDLQSHVTSNPFGGIHIQHTGSCGESTTMLHHLHATWKRL